MHRTAEPIQSLEAIHVTSLGRRIYWDFDSEIVHVCSDEKNKLQVNLEKKLVILFLVVFFWPQRSGQNVLIKILFS